MASTFGRRVGIVATATAFLIPAVGALGASAYATPAPTSKAAAHADDHSAVARAAAQTAESGAATSASDTATDHSSDGTAGTYGDPSAPQPSSNADQNPGGANNGGDCGAYCSTRDGSASANGNGGGQSTGRPCAGCVGRADNKNPKGQQPGPSDHNKGYECDANHGIGRGNPAHTGCAAPVSSGPVSSGPASVPSTPAVESTKTVATPNVVEAPAAAVAPAQVSAATAGVAPAAATVVPARVLGESITRVVPVKATVAAVAASRLPFTGAPTMLLLVVAALSLTAGAALVLVGRRTTVA